MFLVNNDSAVDFSKILARNAVVGKAGSVQYQGWTDQGWGANTDGYLQHY